METLEEIAHDLTRQLEASIEGILREKANRLEAARNCLNLSAEAFEKLEKAATLKLRSESALEKHYYKEWRPAVQSLLLYYTMVVGAICTEPLGRRKSVIAFYKRLVRKTEKFVRTNREFIAYCKSGQTHLDDTYFTLKTWSALPSENHPSDRWAAFLAHERLHSFALTEINRLKQPSKERLLRWTGPKTALIELVYALHSVGSFNEGEADLKQIASAVENSFQVNLGNYYRVFQDIRLRKTGQSAFLDQLKEKFIARVRELE